MSPQDLPSRVVASPPAAPRATAPGSLPDPAPLIPEYGLRLSIALRRILSARGEKDLTLGYVIDAAGDRALAILMAFLILPFLIPMIPGTSTPFGLALMLLGLQLAIGWHKPWLPWHLRRWRLPAKFTEKLLRAVARLFDPLEKIIRPRLPIMQNRLSYVFVGLAIAVNGFLLALPLPIPASNTVPAWMALILILGLTEEDGLTMLVGLIITGAAVGALVLISLLIGFDAIAPAVRHHREHPEEPGWILWSLAHWPWLAAAGFVLLVYLANSKWADRIIAASRDQDRSR